MRWVLRALVMSIVLGTCLTATYVIGKDAYQYCFAERQHITTTYTVKAGDTMWGICNNLYITKNNAECFNEFFSKNTNANHQHIMPGDVVEITNVIYK